MALRVLPDPESGYGVGGGGKRRRLKEPHIQTNVLENRKPKP